MPRIRLIGLERLHNERGIRFDQLIYDTFTLVGTVGLSELSECWQPGAEDNQLIPHFETSLLTGLLWLNGTRALKIHLEFRKFLAQRSHREFHKRVSFIRKHLHIRTPSGIAVDSVPDNAYLWLFLPDILDIFLLAQKNRTPMKKVISTLNFVKKISFCHRIQSLLEKIPSKSVWEQYVIDDLKMETIRSVRSATDRLLSRKTDSEKWLHARTANLTAISKWLNEIEKTGNIELASLQILIARLRTALAY